MRSYKILYAHTSTNLHKMFYSLVLFFERAKLPKITKEVVENLNSHRSGKYT